MSKWKLLIYKFYGFIVIFSLISFHYFTNFLKTSSSIRERTEVHSTYVSNHNYLINNNLAQYSSYLIEDQINGDGEIRAEVFVQFKFKYKLNYENNDDFRCLVKLIQHQSEEVIELQPAYVPRFYWNLNKKFIFKFKKENFVNKYDFNLQNIRLAVIRVKDFNKTIDYNQLMASIDSFNFTKLVVLPYFLINYQIPTILTVVEPKLQSVAFCVHYTYSISKSKLKYWIDNHFLFGVSEILFYDATDGSMLTEYLDSLNDQRLSVKPYRIELSSFCKYMFGYEYSLKLNEFLLKLCEEFYKNGFREKIKWRAKHDQLTSNDCFTQLSQKYEIIGYTDLDEYIFPRAISTKNSYDHRSINCSSDFCSLKPFEHSKNKNLYNYFKELVNTFAGTKDATKINSIYFSHAAFITSNNVEEQIMADLSSLLNQIANSSYYNYPYRLYLSDPPSTDKHTFLIEGPDDVNYLKYLNRGYKELALCALRNFIENKTFEINKSMLRFLFFTTEGQHRLGKSVHFSKNVKTIFLHDVEESENQTWQLVIPANSGHYVSHFRETLNFFTGNFNSSIRNLNIDFEYLFNIIKKHTNYCL